MVMGCITAEFAEEIEEELFSESLRSFAVKKSFSEQQEESDNSQANSAAQSQLATDNSTSNRAQAWAALASSQFAAVSTSIAEDTANATGRVLNYGLLAVSVADPAFGVGRALLADSIYTLESNYFYEVPRLVIRLFPGESFSAATAMEGGESGLINTVDNVSLQIGNVEDDEAVDAAVDAGQGTGDELVLGTLEDDPEWLSLEGHHPIPQFMGGNFNQVLYDIDAITHRGIGESFHNLLSQNLMEAGFPRVGGIGGSADDWTDFFLNNEGSQQQALNILLDTARQFDYANGTNFLTATWENIMLRNFQVIE
jgi:hypothetical protein